MTGEGLNQIRAIMREEIASNNEALSAAFRTELREHLTAAVVAIRQEFAERQGAAAVSFVTSLSELRKELGTRIDALDRRLVALEHRMDRIAETTGTTATELARRLRPPEQPSN